MGNFSSTLTSPDGKAERARIDHGVAVLARRRRRVPGRRNTPTARIRASSRRREFEDVLAVARRPRNVAMILCVGPADRYCGRICCTSALKNAMILKAAQPAGAHHDHLQGHPHLRLQGADLPQCARRRRRLRPLPGRPRARRSRPPMARLSVSRLRRDPRRADGARARLPGAQHAGRALVLATRTCRCA